MRTCPFSLINYKYQCHLARLGKFCKLRNHLFFPFFSPSPLEWAVTSIWLKNKKPTSYRNFLCLKVFLNNNFYFWKNTLATTFCSTVTSLTCCFSSLFPAEKNWYAENLTWVVEQPILPLPTRYCPCPPDTAPAHPFRRRPQYFPDFFFIFMWESKPLAQIRRYEKWISLAKFQVYL